MENLEKNSMPKDLMLTEIRHERNCDCHQGGCRYCDPEGRIKESIKKSIERINIDNDKYISEQKAGR